MVPSFDIPLDIIPNGKTMEVVSSNLGGRYPKGLHRFIKHQPSICLFKTAEQPPGGTQ